MADNEKKDKGIFRTLAVDDVELRVQQSKVFASNEGAKCYFDFLVYKNARVDRSILDETFGIFGWQNSYDVINGNLFCTIKVRDEFTGQWIEKQDVGVESNMEKEKGQASDAFKRAAFAWGIGVELYSAPHIRIYPQPGYFTIKENKAYLNATPTITEMVVDEKTRKIVYLSIGLITSPNSTLTSYTAFEYATRQLPSDRRIADCAAWCITSGNSIEAGIELLSSSYILTQSVKDRLKKAYKKLEEQKG